MTIPEPVPPREQAPITPEAPGISPLATGVAGAVLGGALGAGWVASRKLSPEAEDEEQEG